MTMTGRRPVPISWKPAPLDMQAAGFKGLLVVHLPFKREWSADRRAKVAQQVANAAMAALQWEEDAL